MDDFDSRVFAEYANAAIAYTRIDAVMTPARLAMHLQCTTYVANRVLVMCAQRGLLRWTAGDSYSEV